MADAAVEKQVRRKKPDQMEVDEAATDSHDSLDHDQSVEPDRMTRDEVLSLLGYRSDRVSKPTIVQSSNQRSELCHRCGKKVYQLERIDIGELYHRGCLKCYVCGGQLSLKTYHRVATADTKEVYCKTHIPKIEKSISKDSIGIRSAVEAQKKASEKVFKPYEQTAFKYDPGALEFQHARQIKQRQKVKRRSSLKTHEDYEKYGVFKAQEDLEKRHRMEEDELYRQIFEERQRLLRNLEEVLAKEKEHTVKELIAWFEKQGTSKEKQEDGLKKLEQYYLQQREEQIRKLLEGMAVEERAAVDRMIEKHAQEMLFLIEEKEREAEESIESHQGHGIKRDEYKFTQPHNKRLHTKDDENLEELAEEDEEAERKQEEEEYTEEEEEEQESELREETKQEEEDNEKEEEEEEEEEEQEDEQKFSTIGTVSQDDRTENKEEKSETNDLPESEATVKDLLNIIDKKEVDVEGKTGAGRADRDKKNSENIAMAYETPTDIEIHKLKRISKDSKGTSVVKNKKIQHSPPDMADEETQTYIPVAKQRSVGQKQSDSHHLNLSKSESEGQLTKSPRGKKRDTVPRGSQFQIFISTERIPDDERKQNKSLKKTGTDPIRTSPLKASPQAARRKKKNEESGDDKEEEGEIIQVPSEPNAQPPLCPKSKLYKTPDIFQEFDQRAIEEAKKDPTSFTDLVRRLSQNCRTDLQKVRAIFRWITAKDLNKMKFTENEKSDSPMGLLKGIKYGTESYHNLFKRLCSYAGLHCKVIEGFSKGAGYRPGSKFKENRFRNQWTAVWVDDSWRFINCNWGARHVKRAGDDHMTYKIDEFYFLTDPEQHIYQHFPDDSKWQLLKRPITLDEFVQLPVVKSPFFNHDLEFITKTKSILKATDGCVELRLRALMLMSFAVKLKSRDKSIKDKVLRDCCLIRMVNDQAVFLVDLPSPGQFYMEVFVDSDWSSDSMDNACSFLVYCSSVRTHRSYPQVGLFGRTPVSDAHEVSEVSDYDPLIKSSGELEITLKVPGRSLRLSHTLGVWNQRDHTLVEYDRYAFLKSRLNSNATFVIRCPNKGIYVLCLLLLDPNAKKSKPVVFYRYLIDCVSGLANARPLPHSSSKWYGCCLVEPILGDLLTNMKVNLKVESKSATEVVASVNGTWVALQKNSQNLWQSLVLTGDKSGKVCLYGRFESSKEKYIPLWEFLIKEATAKDEVRTLFKYL